MKSDMKQGLKTIPLFLGKQHTFILMAGINSMSIFALVILLALQVIPLYFIALIGFNIYWYLVILKGMQPDIDYHRFSARVLDSMDIFCFLILFTGKILITGSIF